MPENKDVSLSRTIVLTSGFLLHVTITIIELLAPVGVRS